MLLSRGPVLGLLTSLSLVAAAAVPATHPIAAETLSAQPLAASFLPSGAIPTATRAIDAASLRIGSDLPALLADAMLAGGDETVAEAPARREIADTRLDADTLCLAKAVRHEAGGQSREGARAVAQVIVNRMHSGRFADTVCGVVNQQGQFFPTASYNPDTTTASWATAVAIAREAMAGGTPGVAPGALFFHAAYQAPTGFFRTRARVASLGGNIFYR